MSLSMRAALEGSYRKSAEDSLLGVLNIHPGCCLEIEFRKHYRTCLLERFFTCSWRKVKYLGRIVQILGVFVH